MKNENLVKDLCLNLDIGSNIKSVKPQPIPITYLTQWKIVGNSEVHTDPYLTSWKVSGNSVVDNNTILSCGDLGQDGKYHVKISNGATVYDIPLDEPLRKVNNVADTIEFPSDTDGKALVTRNLAIAWWKNMSIIYQLINNQQVSNYERFFTTSLSNVIGNTSGLNTKICLSANYEQHDAPVSLTRVKDFCMCVYDKNVYIRDIDCHSKADFEAKNANNYFLYQLDTPTTELIDVSPFPVSPTDTYTSANATPYSAFEHTENKEIWSCGEYNATDRKYHILVQPQGGSIADIALDEPLRKVNDVADTIEFPSDTEGKALVMRNLKQIIMSSLEWRQAMTGVSNSYRYLAAAPDSYPYNAYQNILTMNTGSYINQQGNNTWNYAPTNKVKLIGTYPPTSSTAIAQSSTFVIYDPNYDKEGDLSAFLTYLADKLIIYRLATPTTELVDAPQIAEAESYSMVISQGGKAVSWSSFSTD